ISGISENSLFLGNGYDLVKFFFLLTFAAAIPAIISGGIAERSRFKPQLLATAIIVGLIYPLYEGMVWGGLFDFQSFIADNFGAPFHDFAGSIVVHAMGGWLALGAVVTLGARMGRYRKDGTPLGIPPSNIPFLALGSWILCIGWFGFNVMSAQTVSAASGLVALNSLMAMVGGILSALIVGKKDPGFVHNGALAGLVAVCAGSDLMHPIGALFVGIVAGVIFVYAFTICGNRWKIDDVLGVWPLHGLCGLWGGIAAGIFGQQALWGLGGVSLMAQIAGSLVGIIIAGISGFVVFGLIKKTVGFRLSQEDEYLGADLAIHNISATPEEDFGLR
ncbi:MAG TPA: hypothetical protein P5227_08505, partial [Emcibacteraceae bacterium]|nr:hypothetical protein [Emcibacteraceae bacterium]